MEVPLRHKLFILLTLLTLLKLLYTAKTLAHMGQFLQGGKNGRLMSFFFLKVEPPCDQT